jgi:hypothetical protein
VLSLPAVILDIYYFEAWSSSGYCSRFLEEDLQSTMSQMWK